MIENAISGSNPPAQCTGGFIDVQVYLTYKFDYWETLDCAFKTLDVSADFELWEKDYTVLDDYYITSSPTITESTYDCRDKTITYTFEDIYIGQWAADDPGGNIELFVKGFGDSISGGASCGGRLDDVDLAVIDGDCASGECCNVNDCSYKSEGSQPFGYTDGYTCSEDNSPIGTNQVYNKNYYCDGSSNSVKSTNLVVDTCGPCQYCTAGDSTCNNYGSSIQCGTKECDNLDTTCRDYHDLDEYCSGSGTCNQKSCTSYTNAAKHTSCGNGEECDGNGNCGTCDSHNYYSCSDGDSYWYDGCDNREDKKDDCGDDYCSSAWTYYCDGDDLRRWSWCYDNGCSSGDCHLNIWKDDVLDETCSNGCEADSGRGAHCSVYCNDDSDCGSWSRHSPTCIDGGIYMTYRLPTCTAQHYCYNLEEDRLVNPCKFGCTDGPGDDECNPANCEDQCVYGQKRCNGDYLQRCGYYDENACKEWPSSTTGDGNEFCTNECYNDNKCLPDIACEVDSDCGWVDWLYSVNCGNSDLWQNGYSTHNCLNPGTPEASCVSGARDLEYRKKEECGNDNPTYTTDYCSYSNVYYQKTEHSRGCKIKYGGGWICYDYAEDPVTYLKKECVYGCTGGQCNEDICSNECNSWEFRCNGNFKQTCGNYDTDICLEYPLTTNGVGNEICTNGCSSGECIICTSQDSFDCYNNDAYWYDSCIKREGKKEDCGTHRCSSGVCYGDFDVEMKKGWNIFSLPVNYNKLAALLNLLRGKIKAVFVFNSNNNSWNMYYNDTDFNSIYISGERGIWLNLRSDEIISYSAELSNGEEYNLKQGLNLVSYFGVDEESTTNIFNNVISDINHIYSYEEGIWKTYIPGRSFNSLTVVKPGMALWIDAKNDCMWEFKARDDNYFIKIS